jgi:hypothetical protein
MEEQKNKWKKKQIENTLAVLNNKEFKMYFLL